MGLPGWEFLTTESATDRLLLLGMAERVMEFREQEREALAIHIANAVGRLFK